LEALAACPYLCHSPNDQGVIMRLRVLAAIASLATSAAAAQAGTPVRVQLQCPVGGERFTYVSTASMSTWGQRPDGKPYGSWTFPTPLPECPSNGLVLFKDEFTRRETSELRNLIAEPAYIAMRETDTPYYRARWLMRRLEPESTEAIWLLLQASWEAPDGSEQRSRYLREFAEEVATLSPSAQDWVMLQLRAANAWRELGEFDVATTILAALPTPTAVDVAEQDEDAWVREDAAAQTEAVAQYRLLLQAVIDRRDASIEPLDMLPEMEAARRCLELSDASLDAQPARQVCSSEPVVRSMNAIRSYSAP
jgi:hypothetical protein